MTIVSPALDAYLDERRAEIDAALVRALDAAAATCPAVVADAMRYSVLAGGKRLRPVLTLAAAEAVAGAARIDEATARDHAMPAACAIELIHTYSLVHDDLPAMDNDTLRRGRPTAHVVFGEGMAILAGDGLLTLAFEILSHQFLVSGFKFLVGGALGAPSAPEPETGNQKLETKNEKLETDRADRQLRAIAVIARAAGVAGMVGGQAIDLQAVGDASRFGRDALREMHARRTGALIRAAAVSGAVVAGAPDAIVQAVGAYAAQLGLAFQIVDDVLDVESHAAALGKTAGKDAAAGKPTYPALYGLAESKRMAHDCVARAEAALAAAGIGGRLPAIARWVVTRHS